MATNKEDAEAAALQADYDKAIKLYGQALELLRQGDFARARETFDTLAESGIDEPELIERARTYAQICEQRMTGEQAPPQNEREAFHQAVFLVNSDRLDEAVAVLDRVLTSDPTSVDHLYVRASAWAKQGKADRAVADLRQAILVEPTVRFQAINDPDFERIREDPTFIDIVEPTPTGA